MKKEVIRKTNTQEKLKKVLTDLLIDNDISNITTIQICNSAKMNRSTFYANYYDQYDLYDDLKKDLLNECYVSLSNVFTDFDSIQLFLRLIKENALLNTLLQKSTDISILNELKKHIKIELEKNISHVLNQSDNEYIYSFLIDGTFGIIVQWIKNNFKEDIDHICNLIINTNKNINFYFLRNI